jgi:hypothetical protein
LEDGDMPRTANSANLTIAQLEQMLVGRKAELQKLERERNKIARRLEAMDERIRQLGGGGGRGGRNGHSGLGTGRRVRNEKSLNDTIEAVLTKNGKPMKVGDIADAVRASGYRSNSANFRGIVNQTLIKDKRFNAAERGTYQLKK